MISLQFAILNVMAGFDFLMSSENRFNGLNLRNTVQMVLYIRH